MLDIKQRLKAIRDLDLTQTFEPARLNIKKLDNNGFLEMSGETFKVINVSRYLDVKWEGFKKRKTEYWVTELELVNLVSGETLFVEWEVDDELEISKTVAEIKMREIEFQNKPLTRKELEAISEEEFGEVSCRGKKYSYVEEDTWAALFFRDKNADALPVRMYAFESDDNSYLTVESWEDGDDRPSREAFISQSVKPQSVVVLQN
jgi:hypothetical protein